MANIKISSSFDLASPSTQLFRFPCPKMLDPRNTEYFPSISPKGIRKPLLLRRFSYEKPFPTLPSSFHFDAMLVLLSSRLTSHVANHVIFWPRETATLLKSNLRYFHREKSMFEKFDAGLKLRIVFYTHKTRKNRRKNFRVIYTLRIC